MSYPDQVTRLLLDMNRVCGVSGGVRGFEIAPHTSNGLVLELLDAGTVVKRIHYALPAGRELDEVTLLAAHAAAYESGDAWETGRS